MFQSIQIKYQTQIPKKSKIKYSKLEKNLTDVLRIKITVKNKTNHQSLNIQTRSNRNVHHKFHIRLNGFTFF